MRLNQQYYIDHRKGKSHISLDGVWDYAYLDESTDSPASIDWKLRTKIPSSTYRSLVGSGILPDPYKGTNCYLFNWVDEKIWYYRTKFSASAEGKKAFLVFEGVSYFSRVWLNGKLLGEHDGMFGGPVIEVSELLRGENELIVEVKAGNWGQKDVWKPYNRDRSQSVIIPWNLIRDSWTSNGQFVAFGIWRSVRLEIVEPCHLSRPYLVTEEIGDGFAKLRLSCEVVPADIDELHCCNPDFISAHEYLYSAGKGLNLVPTDKVDIRVKIDDGEVKYDETIPFEIVDRVGYNKSFPEPNYFEREITIENPKLWNPVGLGEPDLCHVTLELYSDGKLIDSHEFDFGIRTVSRSFTSGRKFLSRFERFRFNVNGRDFFLRGMNWMPVDFLLDCTKDDYRWALEAARDAGIQLIRVWSGGGIPESDFFYSLCDKYGIMVWQDHFIANMETPNWDKTVLDTQESYNLYRIRNHPSLIIHCGGNEFNAYAFENAASMYIIGKCVHDIDPSRDFVRTTPDGGSAHVYRDMEPVWYRKAYRDLPFLAESGIHSFPSPGTLRCLISEKEASGTLSDIFTDDFRNTHPELICHFTEFHADRVPQMLAKASQITDIKALTLDGICEATQMASYEFYQIMIDSMRENYPVCGGIMPWVFKRQWTTVAVQLMDGEGDALAPYYAVANAYRDITPILRLEELTYRPGESVKLRTELINSTAGEINGELRLRIFSPSLEVLQDSMKAVRVRSDEMHSEDFGEFVITDDLADTQFFAYLTYSEKGVVVSRKFYSLRCLSWLSEDELAKFRSEPNPNLRFDKGPWLRDEWLKAPKAALSARVIESVRDGNFIVGKLYVKNESDVPAYPVSFGTDRDEIRTCFTDSYFLLDAGEERVIGFRLKHAESTYRLTVSAWNAGKLFIEGGI